MSYGLYCNRDRNLKQNKFARRLALSCGSMSKVLFVPTWNPLHHASGRRGGSTARTPVGLRGRPGITIVDEHGYLVPNMQQILDIAKVNDMVVATGHVSPQEHLVLVAEAHWRRIHRVVVSHVRAEISLEDRRLMAEQGAVIELVYRPGQDAKPLIEAARGVGVQHCAMTVDGGQAFGPVPVEAFRAFVGQLLFHGISPEEVKTMVQSVPTRVLGLD